MQRRSDLGHYSRIIREIYQDQKIKRQMTQTVRIPEKIRSIRSLEKGPAAYRQPRELIFVQQARLLKDYESDYVYDRELLKIFPTYQSLTDEQLLGYFGWRTKVRRGDITKGCQAYVHIYIYELLNLVGAEGPEDAFEKLKYFMTQIRQYSKTVVYDEDRWLTDFVVYYRLKPELLSGRDIMVFDNALDVLLHPEEHSAREIFDAVTALSVRKGDHTAAKDSADYCADDSEMFRDMVAESYIRLWNHYASHRKVPLAETYFGRPKEEPAKLFETAVFYMPKRDSSFDVELSPYTMYHCERGRWTVKSYKRDLHNQHLVTLLKSVDAVMREGGDGSAADGSKGEEQYYGQPRWYIKLIRSTLDDINEKKRQEEARKVEIDVSLLAQIRADAAGTRQRLLTAEEMPDTGLPGGGKHEDIAPRLPDTVETDELWRMFDEYSKEDSTDTDKLS